MAEGPSAQRHPPVTAGANRRQLSTRHLTTRLLLHVLAWSLLVVTLVSLVIFQYAYRSARNAIIDALQYRQTEALAAPRRYFEQIESHAELLGERFLQHYVAARGEPVWAERFDRWYRETEPGVLRLDRAFFDGTYRDGVPFEGVSAFVGPREGAPGSELKQRIVIAQYVLAQLGPAWSRTVTNSHISLPENVLLMYSRDDPWGLLADPGLVITDFDTVRSTLQTENPQRTPLWSGLYYDLSARFWAITYQLPVDFEGQHLANASFDISLDTMLRQLVSPAQQSSADHLVLDRAGRVIATSLPVPEALADQGYVAVDDLPRGFSNSALIKALAKDHGLDAKQPHVVEDEGKVLIARYLERPGWLYLSVYPEEALHRDAMVLPLQMIAACLLLLGFVMAVVYWLVTWQISRPLTWIAEAASMVGAGDYAALLGSDASPGQARGEVALVLRSFRAAARRLYHQQELLEREVDARTRELAAANRRLDMLAHTDGLTGLANRRSFEQDLVDAIAAPSASVTWLCIGDLDSFKPYNDCYGHEAGDAALRQVAAALQAQAPLQAYRYGGEEIAILLEAEHIDTARERVEGLVAAVATLGIEHREARGGSGRLTISLGATRLRAADSATEAIRRADALLYRAKRSGGNACCIEEAPPASIAGGGSADG